MSADEIPDVPDYIPLMFRADPCHSGINDDGGQRPAGILKWSFPTGDRVYSSPAVVDGVVYIGSDDNRVYALDAGTGAEIWNFTTGGRVLASPAVANGVVYIGSYDSNLYALDKETGALLWNFPMMGWVTADPVVTGGVVYSGSLNDKLYAIDAVTGAELWNASLGVYPSIDSSPAVADGVCYVTGGQTTLYALGISNGEEFWNFTTPGNVISSSPSVADGIVYVSSWDNNVYALDASNGAQLWNYTTGGGGEMSSSPAVAYGVVYIGSGDNNVYALDALTGEKIWDYTTGNVVYSSPTYANGVVYVGSWDNNMYALDALTGEKIWNYTTGNVVYSSPAVAGGLVYFGSLDGNVYAVGSSADTGNISVSSTPAGAEIFLDREDTGFLTNHELTGVGAGEHTVGLTLAGYQNYQGNVTVTACETATVSVILAPLPIDANFTANETFGFTPMTVQFTDSSTGVGPLAFQWDFWDGTPNATEQSPVHTYTAEGSYNVTLTVSNSEGSSTLERVGYIAVWEPIIVGGDKGYYLVHSNVDGAEVYFNGDWYEGTIENGTLLVEVCTTGTPVWTYTVKKCGYFALTQNNTQFPGKDEVVDLYANLTAPKEPLIADFSANITEASAPPLTVAFTSHCVGIVHTWNWSFGDGTYSEERAPIHTYTALGNYTVTLHVTNSACQEDTLEKEDYIRIVEKPPFYADFTVTPVIGFAPLTVHCTDRSNGNPTSILYEFGDGYRAMGPNPAHTYRSPGIYTITETISKYDPATRSIIKSVATKPDVITVYSALVVPLVAEFSASPVIGQAPLTVKFTDESIGNPTYYIYDFGDGFKAMGPNPTHTYRKSGVYNVSLKVLRVGTGSMKSDVEVKPDLIVVPWG